MLFFGTICGAGGLLWAVGRQIVRGGRGDRGIRLNAMSRYSALTTLYKVFSHVKRPHDIPACACCISEPEIRRLLSAPIDRLSAEDLSNYASSVFLTSGSEADFRYYLPRILDVAITTRNWSPCLEVVLRSLRRANWQHWAQQEQDAINRLLREAFEVEVADTGGVHGVDAWICGLGEAGVDLTPYLARLEEPSADDALVIFFEMNAAHLRKGRLGNPFWTQKEAIGTVIRWLESDSIQAAVWRHYR